MILSSVPMGMSKYLIAIQNTIQDMMKMINQTSLHRTTNNLDPHFPFHSFCQYNHSKDMAHRSLLKAFTIQNLHITGIQK